MDCAAIASGQVCPTTRYARMRDGRLERFCSILCPGSLASCRGIFVLSACASFWSRAKRSKSPPAFFAYRSQRKRGKEISGAPSAQHGHIAAMLRRDVPLPASNGAESGSLRLRARTR